MIIAGTFRCLSFKAGASLLPPPLPLLTHVLTPREQDEGKTESTSESGPSGSRLGMGQGQGIRGLPDLLCFCMAGHCRIAMRYVGMLHGAMPEAPELAMRQ